MMDDMSIGEMTYAEGVRREAYERRRYKASADMEIRDEMTRLAGVALPTYEEWKATDVFAKYAFAGTLLVSPASITTAICQRMEAT
jgi:hypothetical protein